MLDQRHTLQPKSVGLAGDGDEVDLVEDFETTFRITFSDVEAESILTLGDAFDAIWSKLPADQKEQKRCLSAMAYYKLRGALGDGDKISPKSRFEVPKGQSPTSFRKQLEEATALQLDFLTRESRWVEALFFVQFVTWVVGPILFSGFFAFLVSLILVVISHEFWRLARRVDQGVWIFDGNLGDMSLRASVASFRHLVALGGRPTKPDVWKTMTSVIQEHTGFPSETMTPEMNFI